MGERESAGALDFAGASGLEERREAMFSGAAINTTENRAVLHTALRGTATWKAMGEEVRPEIARVLVAMKVFATRVRDCQIRSRSAT